MTSTESTTRKHRFLTYGIVIAAVIVLIVAGLIAWRSARSDRIAQQNAALLSQLLVADGARVVPSQDQIVRVLGDDGGAVCADPQAALTRANLLAQLATGSGGTGSRPVSAGSTAVRGELLIISIYCPDELPAFQQFAARSGLSGG